MALKSQVKIDKHPLFNKKDTSSKKNAPYKSAGRNLHGVLVINITAVL